MRYDHNNLGHRFLLGAAIISILEDHKFSEEDDENSGEVTMVRLSEKGDFKIVVYTTVNKTDRMTRSIGRDAIRVVLLRQVGRTYSPVEKAIKILRVGKINDIAQRVIDAVRKLAVKSKQVEDKKCKHCDAHMFLSKKNNWVCSQFCWTK